MSLIASLQEEDTLLDQLGYDPVEMDFTRHVLYLITEGSDRRDDSLFERCQHCMAFKPVFEGIVEKLPFEIDAKVTDLTFRSQVVDNWPIVIVPTLIYSINSRIRSVVMGPESTLDVLKLIKVGIKRYKDKQYLTPKGNYFAHVRSTITSADISTIRTG